MSTNLKTQSEVIGEKVSLDPVLIFTILTSLLQCWNRYRENPSGTDDFEKSQANLRSYYKRRPKSCLRQIAYRVRRQDARNIDKEKSFETAQAIIDQAFDENNTAVFAACCSEAESDSSEE